MDMSGRFRGQTQFPPVLLLVPLETLQQISDHLMGGGTAFKAAGAAGFQRPVVVVMHRGMDLVSVLRHNRWAIHPHRT